MVEDPQHEHKIKLADVSHIEIVNIDSPVLNLGPQPLFGRQELIHAEPVPRVVVDGHHPVCASSLALEREIPVPRADVEDRQAGEVLRELQQAQPSFESASDKAFRG